MSDDEIVIQLLDQIQSIVDKRPICIITRTPRPLRNQDHAAAVARLRIYVVPKKGQKEISL